MTNAQGNSDVLDGYLAANFADADLAGLTDEQAAVQDLSRATLDWHRSVLREGRAVLAAPRLDWHRIADYANRGFIDEKQTRAWLSRMMDALEKALKSPS